MTNNYNILVLGGGGYKESYQNVINKLISKNLLTISKVLENIDYQIDLLNLDFGEIDNETLEYFNSVYPKYHLI